MRDCMIYTSRERWPKGKSKWAPVFNQMEIPLDGQILKDSKILPALRRIAKRIAKDHPIVSDNKVIGISFVSLKFMFMLSCEQEED